MVELHSLLISMGGYGGASQPADKLTQHGGLWWSLAWTLLPLYQAFYGKALYKPQPVGAQGFNLTSAH